jgi:predicted P-loop ATPase
MRTELDVEEMNALIGRKSTLIPVHPLPPATAEKDFGKKRPATSEVVKEVLRALGITVRLNVISGDVDIKGLPEQFSITNAANVLPVFLLDYMKVNGIKCVRQTIEDCLALIADEERFNPVADMLYATNYDEKDRFEELSKILGIELGSQESFYLLKWMWQSIALALNDEENPVGADGVLVLQGAQGCGKTRFFSVLSIKPDWFAEGVTIDIDKKDSIIQATGCWIAELGELDAMLKRDQSALKAFLTAARDTYWFPYARVAVHKPRRTSFCATVNPEGFLNDETGSRRYWTIHVEKIDVERLNALDTDWLRQLWKQVFVELYQCDPQGFRLTQEERESLLDSNEKYAKTLPFETEVMDRLNWDLPIESWEWFRVSELKSYLPVYNAQAEQIGRVQKKLASRDKRIEIKAPKNVRQYLLPLKRERKSDPFILRAEGRVNAG